MRGKADSLNLSVATGVLVYEVLRWRDPANGASCRI
jgi:tRNA G18 (ribose-2'-O)-methylase SpoU